MTEPFGRVALAALQTLFGFTLLLAFSAVVGTLTYAFVYYFPYSIAVVPALGISYLIGRRVIS